MQNKDARRPAPVLGRGLLPPVGQPAPRQGVEGLFRGVRGRILPAVGVLQLPGGHASATRPDELDKAPPVPVLGRFGERRVNAPGLRGEPAAQHDAGLNALALDQCKVVLPAGHAPDDVMEQGEPCGIRFQLAERRGQFALRRGLFLRPLVIERDPCFLRPGDRRRTCGAFSPSSPSAKSSASSLSRASWYAASTSGTTTASDQRFGSFGGIVTSRRAARPASRNSGVRAWARTPG